MRFPGTYPRSLSESVCREPIAALFGGGSKPAAPQMVQAPAAPTVDQATVNSNQAAQSNAQQAQKKGALSTLLNTGNTQTGSDLGSSAPEMTLKRFLG